MARISAKIRDASKRTKKDKLPLDTTLKKRGRGRPARVRPSEIRGRGDNYRWILNQVWDRLWPQLSKAQNKADVINALQEGASPYDREFIPIAELVPQVLHDTKFPKRRAAQINFVADSLAGLGWISPRRSRDICEEERAKEKRAHHIIRYEVYVECSCGYKGRSRSHACPKCGARIDFRLAPILSLT
jgi:hypothetical protein